LKSLFAWFTPARRKAIYGIVAAGSAALVVFGVVSQDQLNQTVETITQVIAALATLMAFVNTGDSDSI
jgi:hypothetical protein